MSCQVITLWETRDSDQTLTPILVKTGVKPQGISIFNANSGEKITTLFDSSEMQDDTSLYVISEIKISPNKKFPCLVCYEVIQSDFLSRSHKNYHMKKITIKDGFLALKTLIKYRIRI